MANKYVIYTSDVSECVYHFVGVIKREMSHGCDGGEGGEEEETSDKLI